MSAATRGDREALGTAVVAGIAAVGFLFIYVEAHGFGNEGGLFPRLVAVLGGVSSLICVARYGRTYWRARVLISKPAEPTDWQNLFLSYLSPAIYAAALYLFGFWVGSAAALLALFYMLGERRVMVMLALTVVTLGAIYVVFELSFDIRMPDGALIPSMFHRS